VKKLLSILFMNILFSSLFSSNVLSLTTEEFIMSTEFNAIIDLSSVDSELIEHGVLHLSNSYRFNKGKHLLNYNNQLGKAALMHSEQMSKYRFFAHVNKRNKQLSTMDKRAAVAGYADYQTLAENIYYGGLDVSEATSYRALCLTIVNAFISSKGHRLNLLASDLDDMGCGIHFEENLDNGYWHFYFTQDFGKH
jgi:uncharacterized protein YkwD